METRRTYHVTLTDMQTGEILDADVFAVCPRTAARTFIKRRINRCQLTSASKYELLAADSNLSYIASVKLIDSQRHSTEKFYGVF